MECLHIKNGGLYFVIILLGAVVYTDGTCTFPSALTGDWYSSNGGELTFTSNTFSNFKVASFGSFTFSCELSSGTQYVSSSEVFYVFALPFVAYICMDLTAISGYKYRYYQATTQLKDAEYARLKIYLNNTVTVSDISTICELSDYSTLSYHMLLKNNTISSQKIQCPDSFLGTFNYTYDTGSGNLCAASSGLDVCTDKSTMTFDYSLCSEIQAYSAGGIVNCLYSSTSGSATLLHVFNLDSTTDESTYYRFTCYVIETINSVVYATQYPQDCHYGQNATNVNATGGNLVLTAESICVPETVAAASIGIYIAIVILLLIIIIAIIFAIYMWKKKKEEEKRKKLEEEERRLRQNTIREKIENPDLRPEMDLGLPDDSKYNIDRLIYSDDKMVTPSNIEIERLRSQGFEGFDGFDDDYMDDFTRQNMIDASLFIDKRQRLDPIDEMEGSERGSASFMKRFKELARSRIKRKKRKGGKSKGKGKKKSQKDADGNVVKKKKRLVLDLGTIDAEDWESDEDFEGDENGEDDVNLPGQVEHLEGEMPSGNGGIGPVLAQRNVLANRKVDQEPQGKKKKKKKKKKECDTDDEDAQWVEMDLEIATPRLILPNLRPDNTETDQDNKKKKGPSTLAPPVTKRKSLSSLRSFPSMRSAKVNTWTQEQDLDLPLFFEDPKLKDLPPLQRVNRKKNPKLWSDILAKFGGDLKLGNDPNRLRWSESKWRNLLEELYTDKKYFDYMTKSAKHNPAERDVVGEANEGLGYLFDRANFWKEQEPIPVRPPSWRSHSFAHSASSPRGKTPKKSKSFVNSTSVKSTNDTVSGESSEGGSKENSSLQKDELSPNDNSTLHKKKSKLSREKSTINREKSNISKEKSSLQREMSNVSKPTHSVRRERSFMDSPKSSPSNNNSPYDNSKSNTPRAKKVHLPNIDDANKVYKMDLMPKTPLTQVRIEIDREESML
ncbi:eukaryotic translation initiation factor 5B-like isoform X1 [Mytilus edulis]|uniref:eukaryotic translation initiation factor 5B-like isoform X1 n=1 Tax=Mytilus edulis TaxID=6550 RepID=UPI0039EE826A